MSTPKSFQVVGVDGCKAGWCVAVACVTNKSSRRDANCVLELKRFFVALTFTEVLAETDDCNLVCVDIPIGLSDGQNPRECDVAARRVLRGQRASSVFPAPIRPCLSAKDYEAASKICLEQSGKKLNRQSFALLEKIRQVDDSMTPVLQSRVREIHPEISFWALNNQKPMQHKKKKLAGRNERIRLLSSIFSDLEQVVARERKSKEVAPDDILDALVAAWTAAQTVVGKAKTLPDSPASDSRGLRVEILCPLAQDSMSQAWADKIVQQLLSRGLVQTGICLILGAADTGKTTLAAALAKHTASSRAVGIVDADIGQSHIGPPTTVGWAVVDTPRVDFSQLTAGGISFVGDVTPVGHLLQLTAAITRCVQQVSKAAELIIIDTPGLISGPAATALWWTVQRMLQPELILAVQRNDELRSILAGLQSFDLKLELVESPSQIPFKSPQHRRNYRQSQFSEYFRDSNVYNISLSEVAIQPCRNLSRESLMHRVVSLRDAQGVDIAIGLITDWQEQRGVAAVRGPQLDIHEVRCLVIGDVSIDIANF